jgi:hypothetical protein
LRRTICLLVAGVLQGMSAHAASIGLFSSADCSSCNLVIPSNQASGTLYICTAGASSAPGSYGLVGAEFRVDGLPPGWLAESVRAPGANISIGNPFGNGANIAFPSVQTGECILLYTVTVFPGQPGATATLRVKAHSTPSHPKYNCPMLVYADFEYIRVCVPGGALLINSDVTCAVGVSNETWSRMKRLYE